MRPLYFFRPAAVILAAALSGCAAPGAIDSPPATLVERVRSVDCSREPQACQLYGAAEMVGVIRACLSLARIDPLAAPDVDPQSLGRVEQAMRGWEALGPGRERLLAPGSPLARMAEEWASQEISRENAAFECERVHLALEKAPVAPEDLSRLLDQSQASEAWRVLRASR